MPCPVCHHDASGATSSVSKCARCHRPLLDQTSNPVLELVDVSHRYGAGDTAVQALDGVSMSVDRGEVVLVVGPSGGGKTTALLVMGLLLTPDSGAVRIGGRDCGTLSERERADLRLLRLGYLFQDYNLLASLTTLENVALPLRYAGVRKAEALARATELLDSLGLASRAGHRPAALSGGEKQRVATARALAIGPDLILADEPTANLDSGTGRKVVEQLTQAAKANGAAVVIVTHDSRFDDIADRVIHLEDGRLLTGIA